MNHVVCVKWGIKYGPQYANVLNSMVKRHTTVRSMDQIMVEQVMDVRPGDAVERQHAIL